MTPEPKVCSKCGGKGVLPAEDDLTVQQCICSYSRALKAHLGHEIATAPLIKTTPLFSGGPPGEPPKVDRTADNLFIKGYWRDLLSHFKLALGCKGPMFRFRIATDEKLKVVWLGQESYAARSKQVRDGVVTYNSLADLVGPDVDLMIIRLGFLGHKNVAMPGVLKEALMIREFACKPTWIVQVPTSIFGPGHFSYSEEVFGYVHRNFEIMDLVDKNSALRDEEPHGFHVNVDENGDVTGASGIPEDEPIRKPPVTMPQEVMRSPAPERDPVLEGSFKKKQKPGKRNSGDGSPV